MPKLLDEIYSAKVATIHGDLNLQNILIESDERNRAYKQHRLIDFAETEKGPVLLDLQWLETQVITWILAPAMEKSRHSVNVLPDIFKTLHESKDLLPELRATLQTPYRVMQEIRNLAREYLAASNYSDEYYHGLVIALLGTLRFEELGAFERKVAFLSAATVLQWAGAIDTGGLPTLIVPTSNYVLTCYQEGDGELSINPAQDHYSAGAKVTITAYPVEGWEFSEWRGDVSRTNNPLTVTMDTNKVFTAVYVKTKVEQREPDLMWNENRNKEKRRFQPVTIALSAVILALLIILSPTFMPPLIRVSSEFAQNLGGLFSSEPAPPGPGKTAESALAYFRQKGKIVVAASIESGPYSYYDEVTKSFQGLEVEIVRALARQWFGLSPEQDPETAGVLEFVKTSVTGRPGMVLKDEIDFVIGAVAYTPERCEPDKSDHKICTRYPHAYDTMALLVQKDSPIEEYCDPKFNSGGASLVLLSNTTGKERLPIFKANCKFENDIQFIEVPSRPVALEMVESSETRAYKTNRWLISFLIKDNLDAFQIIESPFDSELEKTIMWLRDDKEGTQFLIDETMKKLDSEVKKFCKEAFHETDTECGLPKPLVTACNPSLPPIKIGIAINRSNRYAVFGQDQVLGYNLAVNYFNQQQNGVNGRCIVLIEADLASRTALKDAEWLISQFESLTEKGVVAIIGPGLSQQVESMGDFWQSFNIPVIGPSTTKSKLVCDKDFFARVSAPGLWYVTEAIEEAYQSLPTVNTAKVLIAFADDDAFTNAESAIFRNYVTNKVDRKSYDFLEDYPYQINDPQIDDKLAEIADKIKAASPDIVIISGLTRDGGSLIKNLRAGGYTGPIVGGNGLNTPYIFDACDGDCRDFENFFVPQAYSPTQEELLIQQAFLTAYTTAGFDVLQQQKPRFDPNPGQFAAQMFAAVQVLVQSLQDIDEQTPIQAENLAQEGLLVELRKRLKQQLLESNTLFETPLGSIQLTSEGEVVQTQFYVAQGVKNAEGNGYHFETISLLVVEDAEERAQNACTAE